MPAQTAYPATLGII